MPHKVFKGSLIGLKISYDVISYAEISNDGISVMLKLVMIR